MKSQEGFRFVVDAHLGKLARYLRLCGFDSIFSPDLDDMEIIEISNAEGRIILTRDKLLLGNKLVSNGFLVRSQKPDEQLKELFSSFNSMKKSIIPFTRCMECNSPLRLVNKESIIERLEPRTREFYHSFSICTSCSHIYWEGSHFEKMKKFIANLTVDEEHNNQ